MNTLEALLAVMMMLALVTMVMHAHAEANEALGSEELHGLVEKSQGAGAEEVAIVLGKGRTGANNSYGRWYIG